MSGAAGGMGAVPAAFLRRRWNGIALRAGRGAFLKELRERGGEPLRVGVFSSTTWRPLAPFLECELLLEGLRPELSFFEHGAMEAELAREGGGRFDAALLALDDPEGHGGLYEPRRQFAAEAAARLGEVLARADRLLERAPQVLVLLPPVPPRLPHPLGRTVEGESLEARVARFRLALEERLDSRPGAAVLDGAAALAEVGTREGEDLRLWQMGRIRYGEAGFWALARAAVPRLLLRAGRGIKAVVVDLDDTLWGGLAGEAGLEGIELGEEYPGPAYLAFQEEIRRLKEAGVLLAAASKNNLEDVLQVLDRHPAMRLRSGDFDRLEVHWEPKTRSLARILEAFGIAPEAVLFIDDSPRERAEVAAAYPGLRVLDLPEEPLEYAAALRRIPWPLFAAASAEDARRTELQAQNDRRRLWLSAAASREEYLESLGIELVLSRDRRDDLPRLAQLHQKTNQFNFDPRRLTEVELRQAMDDPRRAVFSLRYRDRFGDAGTVGAAVVAEEGASLRVETFLLSCRVIGLGVERALLVALLEQAPEGVEALRLRFRPSGQNRPAREFVEGLPGWDPRGLEVVLPRAAAPSTPSWIRLSWEERSLVEPAHAS